eukprot:6209312-Pleurochrysis_carterae.AAC.1
MFQNSTTHKGGIQSWMHCRGRSQNAAARSLRFPHIWRQLWRQAERRGVYSLSTGIAGHTPAKEPVRAGVDRRAWHHRMRNRSSMHGVMLLFARGAWHHAASDRNHDLDNFTGEEMTGTHL